MAIKITMKQARKIFRQDGKGLTMSFRTWVRNQSGVIATSPKLQKIMSQCRPPNTST